ncbi:hypothetical protein JOD57_000144 [Geodermatophilus bullaregiensis]|nr:hypothetical protein [Geodermatophilus bullaregiensis]
MLVLPFVCVMAGRRSPRRARQDEQAHEVVVAREPAALARTAGTGRDGSGLRREVGPGSTASRAVPCPALPSPSLIVFPSRMSDASVGDNGGMR